MDTSRSPARTTRIHTLQLRKVGVNVDDAELAVYPHTYVATKQALAEAYEIALAVYPHTYVATTILLGLLARLALAVYPHTYVATAGMYTGKP